MRFDPNRSAAVRAARREGGIARRLAAVAVAVGAVALLVPAEGALALPDLVPEISDLRVNVRNVTNGDYEEGCSGGIANRRLVEFALRTRNVGADDLVIGSPGCPNCTLNPGAHCTNELFHCGTSHGHAHFESFAHSEILDENGVVVASGRKYGFCLLDLECAAPKFSCSYQGLTAGCSDVYSSGLPCQYVDITDSNLPDGRYTLRLTIDPDGALAESNDANNSVEMPFTIGATERDCPEYTSADIPKAVPDLGTATSTLTVPDVGPVTSLRLRMNGTHTYVSDLAATLTSPAATTADLFSGRCANQDNFDLYLGDGALDPFICPATDGDVLRTPDEDFSVFHGEEAAGAWTLTLSDQSATDVGTLAGWSLEVCSICGNGLIDGGEVCDDGNGFDGDCCSADCTVAAGDGTTCEDGDACTNQETCSGGQCVPGGEITCDPCLVCDRDEGCTVPDLVYPCQQPAPGDSLVKIRHDDDDPTRDSVLWRWRSQTPVELDELGAPEQVTDVSLCIYEAGELVLSSTIPAAEECSGVPCWRVGEHDASFADPASMFGGLTSLRMREGDRGKLLVKGKGAGLGIPGLFLSLPATVRLRRSDGTPCWEANYDETLVSTPGLFKARSR